MLDIAVRRRLGNFELDVAFTVAAGKTLVIAGESGSGKTTLLRLLSGLDRPDAGRITLAGATWFDSSSRVDLPAWQRAVGFVPQDYALFPHLTVAENVAFGLRAQGLSDTASAPRVARSLEQFGVTAHARSRPGALSGGQQQRVALARALVLEPELLLLDEPLSALDLHTRQAIRTELRRILETLTCVTVYVTHAPREALALGDRIGVLEHGRLTQIGERADLLRRPRSPYLAAFLGVNLFRGRVVERSPEGQVRVETAWGELWGAGTDRPDVEVVVAVNPAAIVLHRERPMGGAPNILQGRIADVTPEPPAGDRVRVRIAGEPPLEVDVSATMLATLGLREDEPVWASFEASDVSCYQ